MAESKGFLDSLEELKPSKELKNIVNEEYIFLKDFISSHSRQFNKNDDYPLLKNLDDLGRFLEFTDLIKRTALLTNYDLVEYLKNNKIELALAVNNKCNRGCLHCVSDSTPNGKNLEFEKITGFSKNIIDLIDTVSFGLEGEPFDYEHNEKNLGDIISYYLNKGIKKYNISTGGTVSNASKKALEKIKNLKNINAPEARLTYSLYPVGKSENYEKNDKIFIEALENLLKAIPQTNIQILGDKYFKETNIQKTLEHFDRIMLENNYSRKENIAENPDINKDYIYSRNGNSTRANFMHQINGVGRFRKVIDNKLLTLINHEVEFKEPEFRKGIICDHLMAYKKIVIDFNGNARFCDTMLSYNNESIANIYEEGEQAFFEKWYNYNDLCRQHVLSNINKIMYSKGQTCLCKIKLCN